MNYLFSLRRQRGARPLTRHSRITVLFLVGLSCYVGGCATPDAIKKASADQAALTAALDKAVQDFQKELDAFHLAQEELIIEHSRVAAAKQAIELVMEGPGTPQVSTADGVYGVYEGEVKDRMQFALMGDPAQLRQEADKLEQQTPALERKLEELAEQLESAEANNQEQRIKAINNEVLQLTVKLSSMELEKDELKQRADAIEALPADMAGVVRSGLEQLELTRRQRDKSNEELKKLRVQVAAMRQIVNTVDTWIQTDVTLSTEQADELRGSIESLIANTKEQGATP